LDKKSKQDAEKAQTLLDFPDGRAAFADEEASFMITHKRPAAPFESVLAEERQRKSDAQKLVLKDLNELGHWLDNPDPNND
jgi:hypothetical protein